MGCPKKAAGMLADTVGARRVRGQRAGLLDRPQIGGIEAGNRRVSVDLRLMKGASAVVTGLQWLTVCRPDRCSEGLMNACTITVNNSLLEPCMVGHSEQNMGREQQLVVLIMRRHDTHSIMQKQFGLSHDDRFI